MQKFLTWISWGRLSSREGALGARGRSRARAELDGAGAWTGGGGARGGWRGSILGRAGPRGRVLSAPGTETGRGGGRKGAAWSAGAPRTKSTGPERTPGAGAARPKRGRLLRRGGGAAPAASLLPRRRRVVQGGRGQVQTGHHASVTT